MAIVAEWLEITQYTRKPPSIFRLRLRLQLLTPIRLPLPPLGSQMHPQDQHRDACCHLVRMIEDIDKISFAYERCRLSPDCFGQLFF